MQSLYKKSNLKIDVRFLQGANPTYRVASLCDQDMDSEERYCINVITVVMYSTMPNFNRGLVVRPSAQVTRLHFLHHLC